MSSFNDDRGNKIYGEEDPTLKALKKSASQSQKETHQIMDHQNLLKF